MHKSAGHAYQRNRRIAKIAKPPPSPLGNGPQKQFRRPMITIVSQSAISGAKSGPDFFIGPGVEIFFSQLLLTCFQRIFRVGPDRAAIGDNDSRPGRKWTSSLGQGDFQSHRSRNDPTRGQNRATLGQGFVALEKYIARERDSR